MDLLTQIQYHVSILPQELQNTISSITTEALTDGVFTNPTLSVQEAHSLAQLSQIGFVGFESITNPFTPVGLNGELIPFFESSSRSIEKAKEFYGKIRQIDELIQKIPDNVSNNGIQGGSGGNISLNNDGDRYEIELNNAIDEYNTSLNELYYEEERLKKIQQQIDQILHFGTNLLMEGFDHQHNHQHNQQNNNNDQNNSHIGTNKGEYTIPMVIHDILTPINGFNRGHE
jgi:hypothetical protein